MILVTLWILTMAALVATLFMAFALNPIPIVILLFIVSTLTLWELVRTKPRTNSRLLYLILITIWIIAFAWETYGIVFTLSTVSYTSLSK